MNSLRNMTEDPVEVLFERFGQEITTEVVYWHMGHSDSLTYEDLPILVMIGNYLVNTANKSNNQ